MAGSWNGSLYAGDDDDDSVDGRGAASESIFVMGGADTAPADKGDDQIDGDDVISARPGTTASTSTPSPPSPTTRPRAARQGQQLLIDSEKAADFEIDFGDGAKIEAGYPIL